MILIAGTHMDMVYNTKKSVDYIDEEYNVKSKTVLVNKYALCYNLELEMMKNIVLDDIYSSIFPPEIDQFSPISKYYNILLTDDLTLVFTDKKIGMIMAKELQLFKDGLKIDIIDKNYLSSKYPEMFI